MFYITFFLCIIYNKYEPDTERQREGEGESYVVVVIIAFDLLWVF